MCGKRQDVKPQCIASKRNRTNACCSHHSLIKSRLLLFCFDVLLRMYHQNPLDEEEREATPWRAAPTRVVARRRCLDGSRQGPHRHHVPVLARLHLRLLAPAPRSMSNFIQHCLSSRLPNPTPTNLPGPFKTRTVSSRLVCPFPINLQDAGSHPALFDMSVAPLPTPLSWHHGWLASFFLTCRSHLAPPTLLTAPSPLHRTK